MENGASKLPHCCGSLVDVVQPRPHQGGQEFLW